jgi:hypothetical protein
MTLPFWSHYGARLGVTHEFRSARVPCMHQLASQTANTMDPLHTLPWKSGWQWIMAGSCRGIKIEILLCRRAHGSSSARWSNEWKRCTRIADPSLAHIRATWNTVTIYSIRHSYMFQTILYHMAGLVESWQSRETRYTSIDAYLGSQCPDSALPNG